MFPFQLFGFISFMLQSNLEQQLDHWYFNTETSCNILSIKKCFRLIKAFRKRNSFSPSIRFLFSLEGRVIDACVAEKPQVKTWGKKQDLTMIWWRILLSSSSPTRSLELLLPALTSKSIGPFKFDGQILYLPIFAPQTNVFCGLFQAWTSD